MICEHKGCGSVATKKVTYNIHPTSRIMVFCDEHITDVRSLDISHIAYEVSDLKEQLITNG